MSMSIAGHNARGVIQIGPIRFAFGQDADELDIEQANLVDLSTPELHDRDAQLTAILEQGRQQQADIEAELGRRRSASS